MILKIREVLQIKIFFSFIQDLISQRRTILVLAKNDFKNRVSGSFLGVFWQFFQPIVTIAILWFIFSVGFKARPVGGDTPFIVWLSAGIVPWFYFLSATLGSTGTFVQYSYLINKVAFRVSILPMVKITADLFIHLFFILIVIIIYLLHGYRPSLYWLQLPYYLFALIVLLSGIAWITSSLTVFIKDVASVVDVVMQVLFWCTPIFWSLDMLPAKYHLFFRINPVYYITNGYREALLLNKWFWEHPIQMAVFWGCTLFLWVVGAMTFRLLRPHFADVL